MGFPLLVVQSILLGASAFGIGMLPLSFAFSKRQTDGLSNLGTGLLLGAALGVIIPEGAETLAESTIADWEFPTNKFAVAILSGFTFMLLVEKLISGHGHHAHSQSTNIALNQRPKDTESTTVEFDADDIDLEDGHVNGTRPTHARRVSYSHIHQHQGGGTDESRARAYALTLGLVTHAFSDGLALGISALSDSTHDSSELSFIVFLALLLHKAPTTLALSASLLSLSLPRSQCKKHIAVFAASTPTAALITYTFFYLFGLAGSTGWTALIILFSGGSFLYVATVLQDPSGSHDSADGIGAKTRAGLIVAGLFIPVILSTFLGHGHGSGSELGAVVPTTPPSSSTDPTAVLDIVGDMVGDLMEGTRRLS